MKTRTIRRTVAATAIALCATTAVVACGSDDSTGDGGVGALTGDDARAESGEDSKDNGGHGGSKPEDRVKELDAPLHYAGDEVEFTGGEKYEYDDGRTEFGKNAFKYGITIDNLRKVETMTEPDPDAPEDHPDSKAQLDAVYLCYDITARIIDDPNKGTDDELYALDSIPSEPTTQPQWNGYVNDFDMLESGAVRVNPGEDHPEILPRTEEEYLEMRGGGACQLLPSGRNRSEFRLEQVASCRTPAARRR
ncbi:Putative secreted protein [Corynebacterium glyciniphilum AJ 3170]|uniref:Putative secreted protein n=1 Tax=Corynebacterium glyciniphilum AJ 3170 TaxID=1404245 RepID=X5DU71_9CORY|nr:hypothetical protein [Corynebacterium glyciniphilum]AHW64804.1 Putative secreted protein [Corynebacterium glyciniphilum AJ 3170]